MECRGVRAIVGHLGHKIPWIRAYIQQIKARLVDRELLVLQTPKFVVDGNGERGRRNSKDDVRRIYKVAPERVHVMRPPAS